MAANSSISVTNLNFDDIKTSLKDYISSKPEFTDYNFEGSTISLLLDLLSYNTYQNAFYTSMVGNEMFLDSAQLRESVVSRAKMLNYTPTSEKGASVFVDIDITPDTSVNFVTIEKDAEFSSTIDGRTFKFVTPEATTIYSTTGVYSANVEIIEGRPLTHQFTVDSNNPVKYVLPNDKIDTRSISVEVQKSSTDTSLTTYTLADDITAVTANSAVYFLQEVADEQYEVFFGDDVIGQAPDNNNIVKISYRVCNGTDGNGVTSFTNPSTIGGHSNFTVSVNGTTAGGQSKESIDQIKFNAPKNFETQNRAVLAEDYKRIILRENSDFNSISVWGGEENDPPIYGKVYVSVKPKEANLISSDRKNSIKTTLKKYNVLSIEPEFVDATFLYINPTVDVFYDKTKTTLTASEVQAKVSDAIENFEDTNLGTFINRKFRFSKFVNAVDFADPSITSSLTSLLLEKRFEPSTTTKATYTIAFNNAIHHPHQGHIYSLSSSAFTFGSKESYLDDDGFGNVRIYYIDTSTNTRIVQDATAGTIDYITGVVKLEAFLPTAFSGSNLSVYVKPDKENIDSVRNQILLIANAKVTMFDDATSRLTATTVTATTSGVTTNTPSSVSQLSSSSVY
tara:strand:+ start:1550 stop:3415 length:1866 start_codon:yes stop_codon:yes gene_type:complete